jgi:hypothetical protein
MNLAVRVKDLKSLLELPKSLSEIFAGLWRGAIAPKQARQDLATVESVTMKQEITE